jgi:hypothetical protein
MGLRVERDTARTKYETGYGSLVEQLNGALRTTTGKDTILDLLWDLSDDVTASGGNPFHKLRVTIGSRVKSPHSVKQVMEEGECVGYELIKKGKPSDKPVKDETVKDALTKWVEARKPEFIKTLIHLLDHDTGTITKAIKDGQKNAKRATK